VSGLPDKGVDFFNGCFPIKNNRPILDNSCTNDAHLQFSLSPHVFATVKNILSSFDVRQADSTKRVRCFMIEPIQYSIYHSAHIYLLKEEKDWNDETEGEPTGGQQKRLYYWL
jgi:hypothetical protein